MVLDVYVPGELSKDQRELAERLDEALGLREPARRRALALAPPRSRQARQVIRLAVRCRPELAERVLAELVELAPGGVEEERGDGYVEYAIYGAPGELPALPDLEAVAGDGLVEVTSTEIPDDWADRWQDFHRPLDGRRAPVGAALVGGSRERRTIDVVVDPGQAFGTGAHPTTRMCLELLLELADAGHARGAARRLGHRLGGAGDRRGEAGLRPGRGLRPRAGGARGGRRERRARTGSSSSSRRVNLRRQPPPWAPTAVANLTAPILREVSGASSERPSGWSAPGCSPRRPTDARRAFAARGLTERLSRSEGDWVAISFAAGSLA